MPVAGIRTARDQDFAISKKNRGVLIAPYGETADSNELTDRRIVKFSGAVYGFGRTIAGTAAGGNSEVAMGCPKPRSTFLGKQGFCA